jgi:hypothetical protein
MNTRPLIALATFVLPALGAAQSTCKLDPSTSEAKLLAFFAGPLAFSFVPGTSALEAGKVVLAGELALLPSPPSSIANSSGNCFGYSKAENSELSPVLPRPRLAVGLGNGIVAEASWLPPVTVADATPNLVGLALSWTASRPLPLADARLTLRAHATIGGVDGPITCPRSQLQQSSANADCFGSTPSDDTYEPNARGVEAVLHGATGSWGWHAGGGATALAPRLQVNFTTQNGAHDGNRAETSMTRVTLVAGGSWNASQTLALSAQVYSVPSDATTARLGIAWRVR